LAKANGNIFLPSKTFGTFKNENATNLKYPQSLTIKKSITFAEKFQKGKYHGKFIEFTTGNA
jgi:hypothetical protein